MWLDRRRPWRKVRTWFSRTGRFARCARFTWTQINILLDLKKNRKMKSTKVFFTRGNSQPFPSSHFHFYRTAFPLSKVQNFVSWGGLLLLQVADWLFFSLIPNFYFFPLSFFFSSWLLDYLSSSSSTPFFVGPDTASLDAILLLLLGRLQGKEDFCTAPFLSPPPFWKCNRTTGIFVQSV